jgi:hypothetical protein
MYNRNRRLEIKYIQCRVTLGFKQVIGYRNSMSKDLDPAIKAKYVSMYRGDIFRVQTRRVSQTIVFRTEKSGVDCVRNVVKIVLFLPDDFYDRNITF